MGTYYISDELVIRISKLGLNIHSFIKTALEKAVVEEENKKEVKTNG
jgi:post-segregation antitoxin (ccd killing protein)